MRKILIKRVFLVDDNHNRIIIPQDFMGSISDTDILNTFYEIGRDVWIGNNLYHITHQNGQVRHLRYEVNTVIQYVPSWYNLLFSRLAGIR